MNVMIYKIAALTYLGILVAAAMVPGALDWRIELKKLPEMLRKLFLVYAAFIALTIACLGLGTWFFADELATGAKSGMALAIFGFIFWGGRMGVQFFVFDLRPYLKGTLMKVGDRVLTAEFVGLFGLYGWTVFANL